MFKTLTELMKHKNAQNKVEIMSSYVGRCVSVLDFGCGDLSMAYELGKLNPGLVITGIDVIDFGKRYPTIRFQKFDGQIIPYGAKTFDVVIAWHVFHHTSNPLAAFLECTRVAKHRVIFVEPVWRYRLELPGMMFMDWLFNIWKSRQISMAFHFHSEKWWTSQIKRRNLVLKEIKDAEIMPVWSPTGRSLLFVADKK